jgi:PAS domain-containing protein
MQSGRRTITAYLIVMSLVTLMATTSGFGYLYYRSLQQQEEHLKVLAATYARLLEGVLKKDGSTDQEVVALLRDAPTPTSDSGWGGHEVVFARRDENRMLFLFRQKNTDATAPLTLDLTGSQGEPMRRALNNIFGVFTGIDYRGVTVLAAHAPILGGRWGVVVKVDQADVRRQFMIAASIAFLLTLLFLLAGSWWIRRISKPWLVRLFDSEVKHRTLFEKGSDSIFLNTFDAEGLPDQFVDVNVGACRTLGYQREDLLRNSMQNLLGPESLEALKGARDKLLKSGYLRFEAELKT